MAKWYSLQESSELVPLASTVESFEEKHVLENDWISLTALINPNVQKGN